VHAVFPSRRGLLPSVRAFLDYLAQQCAAERQRAWLVLRKHEG
jgi:DNA-binding transcriptional LysR family regulator